jgi:hypothetical protein
MGARADQQVAARGATTNVAWMLVLALEALGSLAMQSAEPETP